jgi:hypothetical protein
MLARRSDRAEGARKVSVIKGIVPGDHLDVSAGLRIRNDPAGHHTPASPTSVGRR